MSEPLKVGIIGFDTSHVPAFTQLLNDVDDPHHIPGARIVAGFPAFSPDLEMSYSRVEGYTRELRDKYQVEIVDSIGSLLERVDAVLLESVDGRRHLAEATPIMEARKPLFIDKPLAANYRDAAAIATLAAQNNCPVFSSSSLRYDANLEAIKNDTSLGTVLACDAYGTAKIEPINPGLFFYGIHGIEILFSFLGAGCRSVRCHHTAEYDVAVGQWAGGCSGTMRGLRAGAVGFGATVFGTAKILHATHSLTVPFYSQLLREVVPFLKSGNAPVPIAETLEIMAFMQAALLSVEEDREVSLQEITG